MLFGRVYLSRGHDHGLTHKPNLGSRGLITHRLFLECMFCPLFPHGEPHQAMRESCVIENFYTCLNPMKVSTQTLKIPGGRGVGVFVFQSLRQALYVIFLAYYNCHLPIRSGLTLFDLSSLCASGWGASSV